MPTLTVDPSNANAALLPTLLAKACRTDISIDYASGQSTALDGDSKAVVEALLSGLPPSNFLDWARQSLHPALPFPKLRPLLETLDAEIRMKTFFDGGVAMGPADAFIFGTLKGSAVWAKLAKESEHVELRRWWLHMLKQDLVVESIDEIAAAVRSSKPPGQKDQASFEIDLKDAKVGSVVTRFPPEPSGYLHIGHAKAAMLNEYFARKYKGKLIVRFDDTNPSKESCEFEDSILEDLRLMGITGDIVTHTSDYFGRLLDLGEQMLREGTAYVDDTVQEVMREQRGAGIASACRDNSVEENLCRYREMLAGTAEGLRNCVRAKMSIDAANKALRDPVMIRCNLTPHHRTGTAFKAYPTYDFACPVVDSIEGVTHALRTSEYNDRNEQYAWFQQTLRLSPVHIWDYSRLNFVYTLLSKRKLAWFVSEGYVAGWDDPRFPTVRGIRRRGLTVEALREYILMQGPSKNTILLEWDKLWAVNRKVIDPIAPRHTAIDTHNIVKVTLTSTNPDELTTTFKCLPKHKKNTAIGDKLVNYSATIFIEQADAAACTEGEEVTLMDWGNMVVQKIDAHDGIVVAIEGRLNLAGDVKGTAKKLTWLSPDPHPLVRLALHDYDYLITKKKLEEQDDLRSVLAPVTEFVTEALGDCNLRALHRGSIIQLERKGFFICDHEGTKEAPVVKLIAIPDGRIKSTASKAA